MDFYSTVRCGLRGRILQIYSPAEFGQVWTGGWGFHDLIRHVSRRSIASTVVSVWRMSNECRNNGHGTGSGQRPQL